MSFEFKQMKNRVDESFNRIQKQDQLITDLKTQIEWLEKKLSELANFHVCHKLCGGDKDPEKCGDW